MPYPVVIDLYHGDTVIDFAAPMKYGIRACIHKASESTNVIDAMYDLRRKAFTARGYKWGAYHFLHGANPVAEADHFLSVAQPDNDTLIALDWEPVGDVTPSADAAQAFLERVEGQLGRKAVIYSGSAAKEQITGKDDFFGTHRLWLAQYSKTWTVQESWQAPWLWQNNGDDAGPGPHRIPGVVGNCDNSCIVDPMTTAQLLAEWAS